MNKSEQNLVKAIKGGNYDKANKALSVFVELKSSTDKQKNQYFDEVEALNEVIVDLPKDVVKVVEVALVEDKFIEVPRVEKRGLKAKSIERKEVDKKFDELVELSVNYFAQQRRGKDSTFARRLVRRLSLVKRQIFR